MMLTAERLREVLAYDPLTGIFTWRVRTNNRIKVGDVAGFKNCYVRIQFDGCTYQAHRLAWLYMHGIWPIKDLDHRDENKFNNRIANLRPATNQQNQSNVSSPYRSNKNGVQGVSYDKPRKKYRAQIQVNGVKLYLGLFDTAEQASEAYIAAKAVHHPFWAGA